MEADILDVGRLEVVALHLLTLPESRQEPPVVTDGDNSIVLLLFVIFLVDDFADLGRGLWDPEDIPACSIYRFKPALSVPFFFLGHLYLLSFRIGTH